MATAAAMVSQSKRSSSSGNNICVLALRICLFTYYFFFFGSAVEVTYDNRALKIDGERKLIIAGSIHYPRSTPEMWPSLIKKSKEGGLNAIETYAFWNAHEPLYRQYDFSGNLDFIKFLKYIQNEGLYAIFRIGPYVCAEWNYGGFPMWLHSMHPNITMRTKDETFMNEMKIFTTLIVDMLKKEKLFASQGGPIILSQIENEYGNIMSSYGADGISYINWCADFALSLDTGVPWIMCQQDNAPPTMINTCNGFYCDGFTPRNKNIPKFWTENWTGWFKKWGGQTPHRTAEDVAFAVARFFQYGGSLQNYYMYHGGTNFGRASGGPYITTSYEYDAPLDEYGNLNQPKWGHLRDLHLVLTSLEKILTYGDANTTDYGNYMSSTVYTYNGQRACFFGNANASADMAFTFEGKQYNVPAWSVTILKDCNTEIFNTARVNTQTSVKVKKPSGSKLVWTWRAEKHAFHYKIPSDNNNSSFKGVTFANVLLDQKSATSDTSDYLWYMTSVEVDTNDPTWGNEVRLQVSTDGPVLHAFVNGKYIDSQWGTQGKLNFVFDRSIRLKQGKTNTITLLSVTVGLQNYGAFFDRGPNGINGPIKLIAPDGQEKDLSAINWAYKTGMNGIEKELHKPNPRKALPWKSSDLPVNRMFVWYKTTFASPQGDDPVVLDLSGMGKGTAWVNGNDIGRYWPSFLADENGCDSAACDYRGNYSSEKCLTDCGQPTQRWYHVPRSFLQDGENTLVLFEEFGGDPSSVSVQTVTVGAAHGIVDEGSILELSCQGGKVISGISFASFGDPNEANGSFQKGSCESLDALSVIHNACVGKERCSINVTGDTMGSSSCSSDMKKRLAVSVVC